MRDKDDWPSPDDWPSERIPIEVWGAIFLALWVIICFILYTDWYNHVLIWN